MPRPKKIGLDYFPLDTVWDEKIKVFLTVFENNGLSWIITFWQFGYRDEFGLVNTNKYFGEILAKESRNTTEKQSEMIKMALEIKLIKEVEPGIYTSNGIQKRISLVSKERSGALKRYEKNKDKTKIKIKESKVKDFGDTSPKYFYKPTIEEIKVYCIERKNQIDAEIFFNHYESNGWMIGKSKMKKWKAAIITWEKNNQKQQQPRKQYGRQETTIDELRAQFERVKLS